MDITDQLKVTATALVRQHGLERALKKARNDQKVQAKLGNQAGVDGWEEIINHIQALMAPPRNEDELEKGPDKPIWKNEWGRK
jgi:hypothetical protein